MPPALVSWIDPTVHVGDIVAAVSVLAAIGLGWRSLSKVRATMEQTSYSELDRFYADLLMAAIEKPFLRTPARPTPQQLDLKADYEPFPRGSDEYRQYDTYALMVWNFIETIHDRCQELKESRDRKTWESLKNTWKPIIDAEDSLHRGWFMAELRREELLRLELGDRHVERDKFCLGFRIFIREEQWRTDDWKYRKGYAAPLGVQ